MCDLHVGETRPAARARASYTRVKRSPLRTLVPFARRIPSAYPLVRTPFRELRSPPPRTHLSSYVRRYALRPVATTKRRGGSLSLVARGAARSSSSSSAWLVGVRGVRARIGPHCCTPANRRQISPGRLDACLRCLSSVPINIKPHSTNEARPAAPRRPPDVYIGIEARERAVYWVSLRALTALLLSPSTTITSAITRRRDFKSSPVQLGARIAQPPTRGETDSTLNAK